MAIPATTDPLFLTETSALVYLGKAVKKSVKHYFLMKLIYLARDSIILITVLFIRLPEV